MGNYQAALKGLNAAQRQAVTNTEGPVLVIAGPGTGKTQLLATRIAHILSVTDTLPENILCLTFTESAAYNMRDRLSGMIGQDAYKVTISTYHAFGSDLIRRFPDYFTDQGDLEPIDDIGIDQVFRSILGELPYTSPLKSADTYLNEVKSFVSDAKRALLTPDDLRAVVRNNQAFLDSVQPLVHEALSNFVRMTASAVSMFQSLLDSLPEDTSPPSDIIPLSRLFRTSLGAALSEVTETGKTTPLTKWKNAWLVKDAEGNLVADGQKTNQKLLACADVYHEYITRLTTQRLFDYDDMILRAVHALQTNNDLRYSLQEQYLYILLDEFQDTNGAQLRLIELLTDNPVNEGRPNVLAVGDDDQAIYAFQGADYSHMLHFQQHYRDVVLVPLTQNYRSHSDVLHLARGIAEQIEERLHHHFPQIEKTLSASNTNLPQKAIVERREAKSEASQLAWTARQIRELLDKGTAPGEIAVLAPQHKYLEPLVPYLQELNIPVRYEKRENILDDPTINQLLRMCELVVTLQTGQAESVSALWCEVLSFDFWQLPTSFIWQLSWQANDEKLNWTENLLKNPRTQLIALFFLRLSMVSKVETLETILDYLVGIKAVDLHEPGTVPYASPFYAHHFGSNAPQSDSTASRQVSLELSDVGAFWDLLGNLSVLRSRLRDYRRHNDSPLGLNDLLEFVAAHRAANIKILNTSPYQNAETAVQLMTAYKAKGMEFSAVFVLAVSDEAWGTSARSQANRIPLPANLRHIRYQGATSDERLRLFYVAVTRAKTTLYLLNYLSTFSGKPLSRLQYLEETAHEGVIQSPLLPDGSQQVLPIGVAKTDTLDPAELSLFWQQRHYQALGQNTVRSLLKSRLEQFQLSPTHINAFIDLEHAGPAYFFMNTILRFPKAPLPTGQFGNAMHETLEWLHIQNKQKGSVPSLDATLKTFETRLRQKRLSHQDTELLQERGRVALRAYLDQRQHTILAGNECEHSFRREGVLIGQAHMAGKIDKLIIDKKARTIAIVDYKTGKSHQRWDHSVKLHKYRQQLYLYKALVEGSSTFSGYNVTDAYLEFIEPDDSGDIHELHLTFDDEEYRIVRELAERVWQLIQNIELPDVSQYAPTLAGVQSFERFLLSQG